MEKEVTFKIDRPFITLGQLLKEEGIIPTGGAAKWFLKEQTVTVNGQPEDRRGKKLYPADEITVTGVEKIKITG
ncbi:MAG TPA: S4 domain-containing protein YaaA [Candidatus Limosilactobacillus faecipullorum]|nr:S4 domain-containing protein YaaA [Candidatus Limosilactobacillus faecipullorum]